MQSSQPTQKVRVETDAFLWRPKLSRFLVLLIFLLASTQLGLHLWPDSALVFGTRVDYLSPTIHFLDLLVVVYLITRASRTLLNRNSRLQVEKGSPAGERSVLTGLEALAPLLLTNLLFSTNPLATLSWSLHFLLYFIFVSSLSPYVLSTIYYVLPLTMSFQVVLGSLQVFLGHTLQGPLYWLGERAISVGTPNAARGEFLGQVVLRAYGTFSHPNILAGYLVVALLITIHLYKQRQSLVGLSSQDSSRLDLRSSPKRTDPIVLLWIPIFLTSLGILLTQSRSAALALFGIIIPFYIFKNFRHRLLYFAALLITAYCLLTTGALTRATDTSLSDRLTLQEISLNVIQAYPIFGTGASATISTYPTLAPHNRLLQPDHNSFTLLLSWFGIAGILTLGLTLAASRTLLNRNSRLQVEKGSPAGERRVLIGLLPLLPLLPLLLLDHYLLTSPQGLFILLLYLRVTIFS